MRQYNLRPGTEVLLSLNKYLLNAYYVSGILLRCWGYNNEEDKNILCLHVAKSLLGKKGTEKEIQIRSVMTQEILGVVGIIGESSQRYKVLGSLVEKAVKDKQLKKTSHCKEIKS